MKKNYSVYPRLMFLGALFSLLMACTTQSGLTYTAHAIVVPGQTAPIYRIDCSGLLESSKTCMNVAADICKDLPVTPMEAVDGVLSGVNTQNPREITVMCGTPARPQPAPQPQPAPRPQPAPQPQPQPQAQPQARVLLQGDANFATDSAVLTPAAKEVLGKFARANEGANLRSIVIIGYTDSTGSRAHNQTLSDARAHSVLQYLRSQGVMAQEFTAEGHGQDNPVASNSTAEGRALNRRVEVRVAAL